MTEACSHGIKTADVVLRSLFGQCDGAPLASTLLGLLAQGQPVTSAALAGAVARAPEDVARQLAAWPNIERDADDAVVGFAGLTLRQTAHSFEVAGRQLHTWCAWDTLFLPALLDTTARVRSTCPVTGVGVELVVAPDAVQHAQPAGLHVSFPPPATTDAADVTGSFCCHVHFLAGAAAARSWQDAHHPEGEVLDLAAAFARGCHVHANP